MMVTFCEIGCCVLLSVFDGFFLTLRQVSLKLISIVPMQEFL